MSKFIVVLIAVASLGAANFDRVTTTALQVVQDGKKMMTRQTNRVEKLAREGENADFTEKRGNEPKQESQGSIVRAFNAISAPRSHMTAYPQSQTKLITPQRASW